MCSIRHTSFIKRSSSIFYIRSVRLSIRSLLSLGLPRALEPPFELKFPSILRFKARTAALASIGIAGSL